MKHQEFKEITDRIEGNIQLKNEYAKLCFQQSESNFDNLRGLTKQEAKEIKKKFTVDFIIAGRERMFYKDYFFENMQLRFMISYGHGMMDSSYRVFKGMSDNSIPTFSYRNLAKANRQSENDRFLTYPTITNLEEFEETLRIILKINEEFLDLFKYEIDQYLILNNEL